MCHKHFGRSEHPEYFVTHWQSPLGMLRIQCTGDALTALRYVGDNCPLEASARPLPPIVTQVLDWLYAYFHGDGAADTVAIPLAPSGTPYRQCVWDAIGAIPYGTTCSYKDVCHMLAQQGQSPGIPRSVGGALRANPIAILIPCHRVIGAAGALTGYAGNLWRKRWLLAHESNLPLPQRPEDI